MRQSTMTQQRREGRHYGIDGLRTLSMLMVLILHIMGTGGVLGGIENVGVSYVAANILHICAYCAVNCYALISGYVGVCGKFRYSNILVLWLQVVLYVLVGNVLWYFLVPGSVGLKDILKSFLPILQNHYWYFTGYFCMFFFIPLLNRIVKSLSKKQAQVTCLLIFFFFCVLPLFIRKDNIDVLRLGGGYSVFWLSLLYVVGGCFKYHDLFGAVKRRWLLLAYAATVLVAFVSKLFISTTDIEIIRGNLSCDILVSYISPTIFVCSVCLLGFFSRFPRLPGFVERGLSVVAPASFGVYIIHAQPQVYQFFFQGGFKPLATWNVFGMVGGVLLAAVLFYVVFAIIDTGRIWLFKKLRIKQKLNRLEEKWIGPIWDEPSGE